MAIDVVCFFILIRLLSRRFKHPWLTALDHAGEPLIRCLADHLGSVLPRLGVRLSSEHRLLAWGFLFAAVLRLSLVALIGLINRG
jgi:hypothetical protein